MKLTIVAGFLLPIPPAQGGAMEKTWHRLAVELANLGHEVTVISRHWKQWPHSEMITGVRYLRLHGFDHTRYLALNLLLDFIWGLRVTFALPQADYLITNTVALPTWVRLLKPKAGRLVAAIARMPKGQTRFYGHVDLLLALSTAVKRRIIKENPKLESRIASFPLPIDWQSLAGAKNRSSTLTIGYIGRLNPEKGLPILLAAATKLASRQDLPPWRLSLIGPVEIAAGGGGREWLNAAVALHSPALGKRLVILPPEFDPSLLARHYGSIDVFCYPSIAESGETFGVAVAEAMAAGCVPIVSKLECFEDLVFPSQTGLVFDHRAEDAIDQLASHIGRLLTNDQLRKELSMRAQTFARQFEPSAVAHDLIEKLSRLTP